MHAYALHIYICKAVGSSWELYSGKEDKVELPAEGASYRVAINEAGLNGSSVVRGMEEGGWVGVSSKEYSNGGNSLVKSGDANMQRQRYPYK